MIHPAHLLALFDIGGSEILVVFVVVLLLFGGEKLPEFARGFGKTIREFKKATAGIEDEFRRALQDPPPKAPPSANVQHPASNVQHPSLSASARIGVSEDKPDIEHQQDGKEKGWKAP